MIEKQQIGTEFALGASVALVTFTVLYALAAGVTINPLTIPDAIPIEIVAGMAGVMVIIVAVLLWTRGESDSPSGEPSLDDTGPDDDTTGEQSRQPPGPNAPSGESTDSGYDTGSKTTSTARNANLNNDVVNSPDNSTDSTSGSTSWGGATDHSNQSTASSDRRNTERQRQSRAGGHQQSGDRQSQSQARETEDQSGTQTDTEDTGGISDEYRRKVAEFNTERRASDE